MEVLVFIKHAGELALCFVRGAFISTLLCAAVVLLVQTITGVIHLVRKIQRRRKLDARIIRQAKAAGVWNTSAGGRALELYARECGVKKYAGETDAHLRIRIRQSVEYADGCHE